MKGKDFARLARRLIPDSSGYFVKGPMIGARPLGHVLRGLYIEGSSFDRNSLYVWVFVLPLFVPTSRISFNLGKRLREPGGGDRWSADFGDPPTVLGSVVRETLPAFAEVRSAEDVARLAEKFRKAGDPYVQQVCAYAWARAGDQRRADLELQRLTRVRDAGIPWQREMADRAELLRQKVLSEPESAQEQLDEWESETVQRLGLQDFRE